MADEYIVHTYLWWQRNVNIFYSMSCRSTIALAARTLNMCGSAMCDLSAQTVFALFTKEWFFGLIRWCARAHAHESRTPAVRFTRTRKKKLFHKFQIWNNKTAYDTPTHFIVLTFQRFFRKCNFESTVVLFIFFFASLCFGGNDNDDYFVKRHDCQLLACG